MVAQGDAGGLINEASILSEVVKVKCNDLRIAHFLKFCFFRKLEAVAQPGRHRAAQNWQFWVGAAAGWLQVSR